jgi:hypothetical protein
MKVSLEIQSPSHFTAQRTTLQEFPEKYEVLNLKKTLQLLKLWPFLAAENIRDDLQHVVKTDVKLSPSTTSLDITSAGRGRIPFHGPTF